MSWELVAQIAVIAFIASVFVVLMVLLTTAYQDGKNKRDIATYKAGLLPKGWEEE